MIASSREALITVKHNSNKKENGIVLQDFDLGKEKAKLGGNPRHIRKVE